MPEQLTCPNPECVHSARAVRVTGGPAEYRVCCVCGTSGPTCATPLKAAAAWKRITFNTEEAE